MEEVLLENSRKKRAVYVLLILAFSYLFFFHHLGSYSLKEPDEGRYAEIPREMIEQGDYIVPHLDYVRYFEKPPLLYWACALSYKLMGANEWSFKGFRTHFFPSLCVCPFTLPQHAGSAKKQPLSRPLCSLPPSASSA